MWDKEILYFTMRSTAGHQPQEFISQGCKDECVTVMMQNICPTFVPDSSTASSFHLNVLFIFIEKHAIATGSCPKLTGAHSLPDDSSLQCHWGFINYYCYFLHRLLGFW